MSALCALRLYGDEGARIAALVAEVLPGTWSEVAILAEPHRDDARVFLGQVGEQPVAFALLRVVLDEAELLLFGVASEQRRAGLGRRFWAEVEAALEAEGCRQVHLEVRASNRTARRFYEAVGFAEIGARRRYYEAPPDDAILMQRRL